MVLNPSNSSNLEQLALKGLISQIVNYLGQVSTGIKGDKQRLDYYCY